MQVNRNQRRCSGCRQVPAGRRGGEHVSGVNTELMKRSTTRGTMLKRKSRLGFAVNPVSQRFHTISNLHTRGRARQSGRDCAQFANSEQQRTHLTINTRYTSGTFDLHDSVRDEIVIGGSDRSFGIVMTVAFAAFRGSAGGTTVTRGLGPVVSRFFSCGDPTLSGRIKATQSALAQVRVLAA